MRLHLPEQTVDVPAGQLLALDCTVPHDVEALEQSAFFLRSRGLMLYPKTEGGPAKVLLATYCPAGGSSPSPGKERSLCG